MFFSQKINKNKKTETKKASRVKKNLFYLKKYKKNMSGNTLHHHVITRLLRKCLTHDLHRDIVTRESLVERGGAASPASLDKILVAYWHNPDKIVPETAFDSTGNHETHETLTAMSAGIKIAKMNGHLVVKDVPEMIKSHVTNHDLHSFPSLDWLYGALFAKWSSDVPNCPIQNDTFKSFLTEKITHDMAHLYRPLSVPKRSYAQTYYLHALDNSLYTCSQENQYYRNLNLLGDASAPTGWLNGISKATALTLSKHDVLRPPTTAITKRITATAAQHQDTPIGAAELNLGATVDSILRAMSTYVISRRHEKPQSPLCVEIGQRLLTQVWFPVNGFYNCLNAPRDLVAVRAYVAVKLMLNAYQPVNWWLAHNASLSETLQGLRYFTTKEFDYLELHKCLFGEFGEYALGRTDDDEASQPLSEAFKYENCKVNEDHYIAAYRCHSLRRNNRARSAARRADADALVIKRQSVPRLASSGGIDNGVGNVFVVNLSIPAALHPYSERYWMDSVSIAMWNGGGSGGRGGGGGGGGRDTTNTKRHKTCGGGAD